MLFGDEAVWGGDRSTESILKQLITEPSMIIEMKGKDVLKLEVFSGSCWQQTLNGHHQYL